MFCSCLSQGLIEEYQPVVKFTLISLMALMVVCQDFIIYCFLGAFPPSVDGIPAQLTTGQLNFLSIQISSFFISVETFFLLFFVSRHFQIRTGAEEKESEFDNDLQSSSLMGSAVHQLDDKHIKQ